MPELPEVETIARSLNSGARDGGFNVIGQKIHHAHVLWARTLENLSPLRFKKRITGQIVEKVSRRGKFLVFSLSTDTLLMHLRMSGDVRVERAVDAGGLEIPPHQHDRLILLYESGQRMAFNNPRKFGRVWLTDDPAQVLGALGPEPLDSALAADQFHAMLHRHHRMLKPLLLDQHFIAGMGNIYTDEALFRAQLHPCALSNTLTVNQSARLLDEMRAVLREGIQRNGASIDWVYRGGDFQNYFNVYGRGGERCLICGTEIERMLVGQRGTHICPKCQRL
jgi:formamidopyrimidine-DNA glycosylase